MASRISRLLRTDWPTAITANQVRHAIRIRGKPPTIARNLKQRLDSHYRTDPALSFKVDIGLPIKNLAQTEGTSKWMAELKARRSDAVLERESRSRKLLIDLDETRRIWLKTLASNHLHKIANHYGIFKDLFGGAYFMPVVQLEIDYALDNGKLARVYNGNVIKPKEADKLPTVRYEAEAGTLWTLAMTTPDGNMHNADNEYCHWLIGNIPGNEIEHGEQIMDYMRPIPFRGVGYYRYIFLLYKQSQRLDYGEYKKSEPCLELRERDWNTLEFYRKYQDCLTPAGVSFFQSDWDSSVTEFCHSTLDMKEPVFEYDFPKPYVKPQTWFPLRQPFNLYMDRYRDPKEIKKEFLLRKLKNVHPFKEMKKTVKYPNAHSIDKSVPSWLVLEKKKSRLGWGRINDVE